MRRGEARLEDGRLGDVDTAGGAVFSWSYSSSSSLSMSSSSASSEALPS